MISIKGFEFHIFKLFNGKFYAQILRYNPSHISLSLGFYISAQFTIKMSWSTIKFRVTMANNRTDGLIGNSVRQPKTDTDVKGMWAVNWQDDLSAKHLVMWWEKEQLVEIICF